MSKRIRLLCVLLFFVSGCVKFPATQVGESQSLTSLSPLCELPTPYTVSEDELNQPISACYLSFDIKITEERQIGGGWERCVRIASRYVPPVSEGQEVVKVFPDSYKWRIKDSQLLVEKSWFVDFTQESDGVYSTVLALPEQDWQNSILEVHFADVNTDGILENVSYEFIISDFVTLATPQQTLDAYFSALAAGNKDAALDLWKSPVEESLLQSAELELRSQLITDKLISEGIQNYWIRNIEWWSTCCEPRVICQPQRIGAGMARVVLNVYPETEDSYSLTIDLSQPFTSTLSTFEDWVIRDAYTEDEPPLFWKRRVNLYGEYLP